MCMCVCVGVGVLKSLCVCMYRGVHSNFVREPYPLFGIITQIFHYKTLALVDYAFVFNQVSVRSVV